MEYVIWSIIILVPLLLENYVVGPMICEKKIKTQICNIGGLVTRIERTSSREMIYIVYYTIHE
ncbi:hypothetical protein I5677_03765 [Mobilitalea sibirica]|uniref:Uncharacterized protein n=1 Tax=Mobilitalea sibirica TaxID=1462919 RepID=A0A8J7HBH8_9FIRM|nr:hypothetical protein [Mobilitalea sibirica]MBH1940012.1 hypothetical protein [Mobilitalea sibirica]